MNNEHLYAVIIAGGRGTRFWPLSRHKKPKQLLSLNGHQSLLRQTVDRVLPFIPKERVFVVTAGTHAGGILEALPDIPQKNILVEPIGKNTAPALAFAAAHLLAQNPDAIMTVLPSDHVIGPNEKFMADVIAAGEVAEKEKLLVTFGIRPTRPETGYGYIEVGEHISGSVFRARSFREKPNRKKAKFYVDSGRYLWNSGMFVFRADVLMERIKHCLPELYSAWEIFAASGKDETALENFYESVTPVSIDYGVMEKSGGSTVLVAASFSWNDVGSWEALDDLWEPDEHGNRTLGSRLIAIRAEGNTVHSKKLVSLLDVENLIVVETDDALLICRKDRSQEIKSLVQEIERQGLSEYL